jgi:hypothetical protein
MLLNIYSIYDSAANAYATPFFMQNDGLATRAFQANVDNKDSQIHEFPDQFTLFHIGTYDDENGSINSITPKSLGNALTYKTPDKQETELGEIMALLKSIKEEK